MESPEAYAAQHGAVDEKVCPQASPEDTLDCLTDLAVGSPHPVLVVSDGKTVGIVTGRTLLRGIQGHRSENGPEATA